MSLEMFDELTRLLQLEADALTAYGAAAARVPPGAVRDELALFKVEHQRHALALHETFLRLGRTPPEVSPDVKGVVIGALTPPRARLSETEILEAIRGNEQLSNSLYAKALQRPFPAEVRELIEWAQTEERRHLSWVERALSRRGAWSGHLVRP